MILNFSEDEEWPEVLPAIFPRLLINGSQGIGVTIANLCILLKVELLLIVFGFIMILETLSVIIQVIYFKCYLRIIKLFFYLITLCSNQMLNIY